MAQPLLVSLLYRMDIFRAIKRDRRRALHLIEQIYESAFDDSTMLDHMLFQLKDEIEAHTLAVSDTLLRQLTQSKSLQQTAAALIHEGQMLVELSKSIERPQESERLAALKDSLNAYVEKLEFEIFERAKEFLSIEDRQELGSKLLFLRNVAPLAEPAFEPRTGTFN